MAKVQASPEVVREMKSDLNKTAKELGNLSSKILSVRNTTQGEWSDAQGEQFRALMTRIARLIGTPAEALNAAQPKLEKLAQSLDSYGKVKF